MWPGVTKLREYKLTFPNYPTNELQKVVSGLNLDNVGLDLLNVNVDVCRGCCDTILIVE